MRRFYIAAVAGFLALQAPGFARASTFTYDYDLTLTPTSGSIGGTGTFDVTTTVNPYTSINGSVSISDLSVTIGGVTFTLGDAIGSATATFANGVLTGLSYLGDTTSGLNLDILGSGGLSYLYFDFGTNSGSSSGVITATYVGDPPGAAPLPATWVLFAAGLAMFGIAAYRRRSSTAATLRPAIA
jgi:hypothetical protein